MAFMIVAGPHPPGRRRSSSVCSCRGRFCSPGQSAALIRGALSRCRGEAMAAHDLGHLDSIRWPTGRRLRHLGNLAEILRTDRGGGDGAKCLHVLAAVVVEPVNGAARNAEGLPRPDVDRSAVDGPGQHALDAVDRFFVVIVAVRRSRQTLRAWDRELEEGDAATRLFSRNQEAYGE